MQENPVIRGFSADSSFCRAEEDCYISASTLECCRAVQIRHSCDLVNRTLFSRPLHLVALGVAVDRVAQRFSVNGVAVRPELHASVVSDEGGRGEHASFSGPSSASSRTTCRGMAGRPM